MGRNKKEAFLFTFIMCALMVLGMSIYNVVLMEGWSGTVIKDVVFGYLPAFIVALILDVFVVGKVAKGIANKLVNKNDPMIKRIMCISFFMVTGMVLLMSFYGAILHVGWSSELPMAYLSAAGKNFIAALPLQIVVVGPLTRLIFVKITPATV